LTSLHLQSLLDDASKGRPSVPGADWPGIRAVRVDHALQAVAALLIAAGHLARANGHPLVAAVAVPIDRAAAALVVAEAVRLALLALAVGVALAFHLIEAHRVAYACLILFGAVEWPPAQVGAKAAAGAAGLVTPRWAVPLVEALHTLAAKADGLLLGAAHVPHLLTQAIHARAVAEVALRAELPLLADIAPAASAIFTR